MFDKFYKHSIDTRKSILSQAGHFDYDHDIPLDSTLIDTMIENAITTYEIPFGVVPDVLINGKKYVIPMVTEEPSVIAAQSNAAKIFRENGGIETNVVSRLMRGEIAFVSSNITIVKDYLDQNMRSLIDICNKAYPSIVNRGGGVKSISCRLVSELDYTEFVIVDVFVDTQEAMGANMINTILENLKNYLTEALGIEPLMAILSNLADTCLVEAKVTLDPKTLKNSQIIAQKIKLASDFAFLDPYRAATNNKGIMNGIDAVVIATGNDFRAVEAGIHAYASQDGRYRSLSRWDISPEGYLVGTLRLPMAIGTVGGTISIHPKAQLAYKILQTDDSKTLMGIIAGVGLAQNFAALYALTTDGIQKGHMRMHARTLIAQTNCPENLVKEAVNLLIMEKPLNLDKAKNIVEQLLSK